MADRNDQLAAGCVRGDPEAFRAAVDLYGRAVEGTLVHILGPRRDLEDLVQDVFFEFARAVGRFRGDSKLATFLMGIAANVARRVLERGRRHDGATLDFERIVGNDNPEAQADARQQLARTFEALDRLDARQRIAFVLHVVEGRDVHEVARIVGIKERAVRARVQAARAELARLAEGRQP